MEDLYYTISEHAEGIYKEKGSKFISYAFHIKDEADVEEKLIEVKNLHHKARHFCYAYEIGMDGNRFRANDDGEPSGTAGKPILGQIHSFELSDVLVIVVRYFGGTKLGASGLITAYKEAAKDALSQTQRREVIIGDHYVLSFGYEHMGHVMNCIKNLDLEIVNKTFEQSCEVILNVRLSEQELMITNLKSALLEISTDQVNEETVVPFCSIEKLNIC